MLKKVATTLCAAVMLMALSFPIARSLTAQSRHPEMAAAERSLREAQNHLQRAAHDFGGHRVKAMEHVNAALEEMRLAQEVEHY
jgi:hypothetical protein